MPRRKTDAISATMSKVSSAVRQIEAQREPHAELWDDWNQAAVVEDGPLWVALGDSTSQGIGPVDPLDGWISQVLDRLRSSTSGVSSPFNSLLARRFTRAIERAGEEKSFQLLWPWDWPSRDGMGEYKWHPGPKDTAIWRALSSTKLPPRSWPDNP